MTTEHPVRFGLLNTVFLGTGYLSLNLYSRFFIAWGFFFAILLTKIILFIFQPLNGSYLLAPLFLVLALVVGLDGYALAKQEKRNTDISGTEKPVLKQIGYRFLVLVYIIGFMHVFLTNGGSPLIPGSYRGARLYESWYRGIIENHRLVAIRRQHKVKTDATCEQWRADPSLIVDQSRSANAMFTESCYFQRAVENRDPFFCRKHDDRFEIFEEGCVGHLARVMNKKDLCASMLAAPWGCKFFQSGTFRHSNVCTSDAIMNSPSIATRCNEEFDTFFRSLQP